MPENTLSVENGISQAQGRSSSLLATLSAAQLVRDRCRTEGRLPAWSKGGARGRGADAHGTSGMSLSARPFLPSTGNSDGLSTARVTGSKPIAIDARTQPSARSILGGVVGALGRWVRVGLGEESSSGARDIDGGAGTSASPQLLQFVFEIETMTKLRHPNIALFMGASLNTPVKAIVVEYLQGGTLMDRLHSNADIPWAARVSYACDCARGMLFLHSASPPIFHRDLKAANVLLDNFGRAKVADFGISRLKSIRGGVSDYDATDSLCGTLFFMAPELFLDHNFAEHCDVYSFGVVLCEIASRRTPYSDLSSSFHSGAIIVMVVCENVRPTGQLPPDTPPAFRSLLDECLSQYPDKRPTFRKVLEQLSAIDRNSCAVQAEGQPSEF
eukprot:Opistho-2@25131